MIDLVGFLSYGVGVIDAPAKRNEWSEWV